MDTQVHRMVGGHPAVEELLQRDVPSKFLCSETWTDQCPHVSS